MKVSDVLRVLGIVLLLLTAIDYLSAAQSVLPAVDAIADSGRVTLRWTCQYDGIKSITVKRSADSTTNFSTIGYVKDVRKGEQHFTDFAPISGVGYYKLNIIFNSGLSWSSNICRVLAEAYHVNTLTLQSHYLNNVSATDNIQKIQSEYSSPINIKLSFPDVDMNDASFILPRYVMVHKVFGHVVLKLPIADFKQYAYSIRFFSSSGVEEVDIPQVKLPEIIIDKRNFGRNDTYKYIIRRDGVLLESGYIKVTM